MTSITLQFVLEDHFTSRLIGWFSAGHYSHVDAVMPYGLLGARNDSVGGRPPGVQIRPFDYTQFIRTMRITVPCSAGQYIGRNAFLREQLGKPYDRLAILAFAFNRNWRDQGAWYCSELQAAALEHAGILPRGVLTDNKITPVMLAEVLSVQPGAVVNVVR